MKKSIWAVLAAIAALVALAVGVSGASARTAATAPVTLKQCTGEKLDRTVTYDTVPTRVFALDPQSAEFMFALGLGDKLVATWFNYGPEAFKVTGKYTAALKKMKVLNDGNTWPTPVEQIAGQKADFVLTIYRVDTDGYLDATRLQKDLGIKTYGFTTVCSPGVQRTLDPVFENITNLGRIFHVEARAAALITTMKGQLKQAEMLSMGKPAVTMFDYSGGKTPSPIAGHGVGNAIMTLAGAKNVFEELPGSYAPASWEQVVKRNPSVIWLLTDSSAAHATADKIQAAAQANPGLGDVTAVKAKRYVVIPYDTGGVVSVHNAEAVLSLARQIAKLPAA